jgi:hypothetical protein
MIAGRPNAASTGVRMIGVPVASVRPFYRLDPINDPRSSLKGRSQFGFSVSTFKVANWGPIA